MRILSGKVVDGKVVVDKEHLEGLEDGTSVTVLVSEGESSFSLTEAERAELAEAIAEVDRGDLMDVDTFLRELQLRS